MRVVLSCIGGMGFFKLSNDNAFFDLCALWALFEEAFCGGGEFEPTCTVFFLISDELRCFEDVIHGLVARPCKFSNHSILLL